MAHTMISFSSIKKIDFQKLRRFYERYERYLIPGALLFGVITDVILFSSINFKFVFLILTLHFIASGTTIAFIHIYDEGFFTSKSFRILRLFAPLILQYTFGALLSASLIFYWFSSSFFASWPFIIIIIVLMLSNDLLKRYYLWLRVQVGVYFFISFSLSVLILPFILEELGTRIFFIGGLLSLLIIICYLFGLSFLLPEIKKNEKQFAMIIGVLFLTMNVLYFTNVIPPVPLSLREAEVMHFIQRDAEGYRVLVEEKSLWVELLPTDRIHIVRGDRVYFFSSVFAPARLETDIVHRWQYYDKSRGKWIDRSRIGFPIVGGRDGGYRGYSLSGNVFAGRWRVLVETSRGQVIGKASFTVVEVDRKPKLSEERR